MGFQLYLEEKDSKFFGSKTKMICLSVECLKVRWNIAIRKSDCDNFILIRIERSIRWTIFIASFLTISSRKESS